MSYGPKSISAPSSPELNFDLPDKFCACRNTTSGYVGIKLIKYKINYVELVPEST